MKYNDNGTYKDIYVKAFDTLPVGAEVDYDGSVVPDGWTEIDNPNEYSTDEVRIGTWIDGKPLYRKVIILDALKNNGELRTYYDSTYIIQKCDIYIENPIASYKFKLPVASTNYIGFFVADSNHYIAIQTTSDRTGFTDNYAIIEYTKTTD